jgi:hypothetical protein
MKSRIKWAEHVARMEGRGVYSVLMRKPEGKETDEESYA